MATVSPEQKLADHDMARKRLDAVWRFACATMPVHEQERMSRITEEAAKVSCRIERRVLAEATP